MKAKILKESEEKLIINLSKIDFETANSIRRACMNMVPTIAIEDVEISENNSALYDEILAHRLGLIPLKSDLKTYVKSADCKCKGVGCARCTVDFTLIKKGPCTVYASDLASSDNKIVPVFPEMIIDKLFENQEIKLIAKAKLNNGDYHIKHSPCNAFYKFEPIIEVLAKSKELDNVCPKKVFKAGEVDKDKLIDCNLCLACSDLFPKNVKVSAGKDIIFTIESFGQLMPKEIFNTALKEVSNGLEEMKKSIK
ncbi:MAG: DNA-directed RNA polymerase subunit D [Candidatus Nanoarchaeia archaeon]|nr:DNA-directed RNA polymerase subunit D [Candidatus Nanoarchaeia archaeon]